MRGYVWSFDCYVFFKQKTAYERRISDWSSDVCSSDLTRRPARAAAASPAARRVPGTSCGGNWRSARCGRWRRSRYRARHNGCGRTGRPGSWGSSKHGESHGCKRRVALGALRRAAGVREAAHVRGGPQLLRTGGSAPLPAADVSTDARPTPPGGAMVEFDNVGLRYGPDGEVLRDISFNLQPGSFYFLTGASGAGKTSLLRMLYLAQRPSRGIVRLFGEDLRAMPRHRLPGFRRRIGVVFQDLEWKATRLT